MERDTPREGPCVDADSRQHMDMGGGAEGGGAPASGEYSEAQTGTRHSLSLEGDALPS